MVFALLSAIGITALLFLWVYRFCYMILGWIVADTP
jgi:hypothetical protein